MCEAPMTMAEMTVSKGKVVDGTHYIRADEYERVKAQRDRLRQLVRKIRTDGPTVDFWARQWSDTGMDCPLFTECVEALAECDDE